MADIMELLQQLVAVADEDLPAAVAVNAALEALPALRRDGLQLDDADGSAVSMAAVTRSLGLLIKTSPLAIALKAAAFYAGLLTLPDAPVSTVNEQAALLTGTGSSL